MELTFRGHRSRVGLALAILDICGIRHLVNLAFAALDISCIRHLLDLESLHLIVIFQTKLAVTISAGKTMPESGLRAILRRSSRTRSRPLKPIPTSLKE